MSSENSNTLVSLVDFMVKSLVDIPDQVNVSAVEGEQTTVIELKIFAKICFLFVFYDISTTLTAFSIGRWIVETAIFAKM